MDWDHQIYFEDVHTNSIIKPISIPITLQRLVMEAGSNRDFSLMHHDNEVAKITGAPSAFANTFFIMGMFERLIREWMGLKGSLKKIKSLRMTNFNCPGSVVTISGTIMELLEEQSAVVIKLRMSSEEITTVTAEVTVILPRKSSSPE